MELSDDDGRIDRSCLGDIFARIALLSPDSHINDMDAWLDKIYACFAENVFGQVEEDLDCREVAAVIANVLCKGHSEEKVFIIINGFDREQKGSLRFEELQSYLHYMYSVLLVVLPILEPSITALGGVVVIAKAAAEQAFRSHKTEVSGTLNSDDLILWGKN